jgi:hypothetical protein
MKRKAKLVLSKDTLRVLTQGQISEVNGGAPITTSFDPYCFYSEASCATSKVNCC